MLDGCRRFLDVFHVERASFRFNGSGRTACLDIVGVVPPGLKKILENLVTCALLVA
ncbi:MAG: hypothetical protein QW225_11315 [Candidatus Jordarchaeales archaeon]